MENEVNPGCAEDLRLLTQQLLNNAQALLEEIQEMIERCGSSLTLRSQKREQTLCDASILQDGETLVIDGFRFEDAASREDLRRRSPTRQNQS